jgi:diguanylate cyclase (GGDEF)-like protein
VSEIRGRSRPPLDFAPDPTPALARLVEGIRSAEEFETVLQHVTHCTAELLRVERVSARILDESGTRLLLAARTGSSLHTNGATEFTVGEGLVGWIVAHRETLRVSRAQEDPRFASKPGQTAKIGSFLGAPLLEAEACIGVLATTSTETEAFSSADEVLMRLIAGIVTPHLQVSRLRRLAKTDPLTCLLNRRALDEVLPAIAGPEDGVHSVALVDIDHFKHVNDRFGHAAGDEVLRVVARVLTSVLRRDDRVLRIGGEEFLVVLPRVDCAAAALIAERARERISKALVVPGHQITASVGVAEARLGETREALLARADTALYQAKTLGRDRVICARAEDSNRAGPSSGLRSGGRS